MCLHRSESIGIADGLDYLHSRGVVHGDLGGVRNLSKANSIVMLTLRQPNIIVDDSGRPRITGFGSIYVLPLGSPENVRRCGRWAEPNRRNIRYGLVERADSTDLFSFAMVMVEVTLRHWT